MVKELRDTAAADPSYPSVLFFYQGSLEEGAAFFAKAWPEARAVSDSPLTFYRAFLLKRGGLMEMFGPGVAVCSLRAASKGYLPGKAIGDPWQMPGLFLVQADQLFWQHDFAHAGDHPDFRALPAQWAVSV